MARGYLVGWYIEIVSFFARLQVCIELMNEEYVIIYSNLCCAVKKHSYVTSLLVRMNTSRDVFNTYLGIP